MTFDVGNGLSLMGGAVAKTAGDYLLQNQKSELEDQQIKLQHSLAMERQTQQQQFQTGFETNVRQPFEKEQTEKTLQSREREAQIHANATLGAAQMSAAAARYGHELMAQAHIEGYRILSQSRSDVQTQKGQDALKLQDLKNQAVAAKLAMVQLPPDAVDQQARMYVLTGKTPMMGRNPMAQAQIMSRVPSMMKEMNIPDEQTMKSNWSTASAAQTNLNNLTKVGGALEAYAGTIDKNMKIIEEEWGATGPTGMPVFDAWIQAGKKATGDPHVKALDQALRTVLIEQAKLNTGNLGMAGLPEGARQEFDRLMGLADNKDTMAAMLANFQADKNNRLNSQQEAIDAARKAAGTGVAPKLGSTPQAPAATPKNPQGAAPLPMTPEGKVDRTKINGRTLYNIPGLGPRYIDNNGNFVTEPVQ